MSPSDASGRVADGPQPTGSARAGAAIVFVILLMLTLLALAHGALVAALGELSASKAAVRELEARAASETALSLAVSLRPGAWMDSLRVWEVKAAGSTTVGPAEASAGLRRLGAESWLAQGTGALPGTAGIRTARLVWALDPVARVVGLDGVVTVGSTATLAVGGSVDASSPTTATPPATAADCDPWLASLVAHYLTHPLATVVRLPAADSVPGLGLLDLPTLLREVADTVVGSGTPQPVEVLGACAESQPWNWGDPDAPWRPCGSSMAVRASPGDIVLTGGAGQGLLLADGDVTLASGARFYGLVVASGTLRLGAGARLEGLALAEGGLEVDATATVRGSGCWAARALASYRDRYGVLLPVPGTGRVGPL